MDPLIYNIPAHLIAAYRGHKLVVRCQDPIELVGRISPSDLKDLLYAQLLSPNVEVDALTFWGGSVPVDVLMTNPAVDFRFLYRFRNLLDKHPIRVSISVKPGFSSAVKLALALNFAVKLEVGQPDRPLIEELSEVLNHYLHRSIVSQPVEYFHSIFLSFYHQEPSSLWFIQEEDPDQIRFVSDDGTESLSTRFGSVAQNAARLSLAQVIKHVPSGARIECDDCEFLDRCGGYFKWPDRSFSCDGVKELFRTIQQAAAELTNDLKQVPAAQG